MPDAKEVESSDEAEDDEMSEVSEESSPVSKVYILINSLFTLIMENVL